MYSSKGGVAPASLALSQMLDAGRIGERLVHVANAYRRNGDRLHPSVIAFLDPGVIIALGREAEGVITALGFKSRMIPFPHPQWINRFEHSRLNVWGEKLGQAIRGGQR